MTDFKVEINAEEVKKEISRAIIEGAIGAEITKELERMRTSSYGTFQTALQRAIESEVKNLVAAYIREQFDGPLRAMIAEKMTDKFMGALVGKAISRLDVSY